MPVVTYVEHDGTRHEVDVANGSTVMLGAVQNAIDGIVAECGGGLACATCHCIVDEAWIERVGGPSETESQMLEFAAADRQTGSRLSCQITLTEALDGLVVRLPESQF